MSNIASLLNQARKDGLHIRAEAGQVRLRGPSEVIQKWRPLLAEHKAALLEQLAANDVGDLDEVIAAAAEYWQYDADDLAIIHDLARTDPEALRRSLLADPLRPFFNMSKQK